MEQGAMKRRTIADVPPGHERVRVRQRAYPTGGQRKAAARLFGCIRVVQNDALAFARDEHAAGRKYPGAAGLQHHVLTLGKKTPERAWLNEVCGVALIQAIADTDRAYRNFFDSRTGKRKGARMGFPRRKRRSNRATARFSRAARFKVTAIDDEQAAVTLSKIGSVRFRLTQPIDHLADASSVTLIREADGRWFVSFVVVRPLPAQAPATGRIVGIDPGLSTFATMLSVDTSTGAEQESRIETPALLRRRARALARSQRAMCRKQKGSSNRRKAVTKVAVQHRKVREARLDHAHQQAGRIVAGHEVIVVEDLNVKG